MNTIQPTPNASPPTAPIKQNETTLCGRVWSAVSNFFSMIAERIASGWGLILGVFSSLLTPHKYATIPAAPQKQDLGSASAEFPKKLAQYREMPQNQNLFVEQAIENYRSTLLRIGEDRLEAFNENFEAMLGYIDVATAVVRAYIFSGCNFPLTFFQTTEKVQFGEAQPPVRQNGVLLHAGGRDFKDKTVDHRTALNEISQTFQRLSDREKELLLDTVDKEGADQSGLTAQGLEVLDKTVRLGNQFQRNKDLIKAIQAAWQKEQEK